MIVQTAVQGPYSDGEGVTVLESRDLRVHYNWVVLAAGGLWSPYRGGPVFHLRCSYSRCFSAGRPSVCGTAVEGLGSGLFFFGRADEFAGV